MELRRRAMGAGITVTMRRIDDPDPDKEEYKTPTGRRIDPIMSVGAYSVQRPKPADLRLYPRQDWALGRQPGGDTPVVDDWCWLGTDEVYPAIEEYLLASLGGLPDDAVKVEDLNYHVTVYWRERSGEEGLAAILTFLDGVKKITLVDEEC